MTFDTIVCLINHLGGVVHAEAGTVSFGSWAVADTHIVGGFGSGYCHPTQAHQSDLHVLFGSNWIANKAGNHAWYIQKAKESGSKFIFIDPWMNQTAQVLADEWIPVLPGGDTALILAICHHWIENNQFDQDYLNKYTIGFDAEHMPEGAPSEDNFKDYVLGTYDGEPKNAQWAEPKCGVSADKIIALAEEIASVDKVDFRASQSATKIPAGEQMVQAFYTMALMHGGIGTPGHYMGWSGFSEGAGGSVTAGDDTGAALNPTNPLQPAGSPVFCAYPIPQFDVLEDPLAWENLEPSETWKSVLEGETGRDCWPGGKHKLDIHAIYFGSGGNPLNALPNANDGIKAVRKMDFVLGCGTWFDASRQYCDIVLPETSTWEEHPVAGMGTSEVVYWADTIMEPLYEAKWIGWIGEQVAERMGVDPKIVNTLTAEERTYATVRDAKFNNGQTGESTPLLTITQEEIDELGVEGEPQEGKITFAEFKEAGLYKYPMPEDVEIPECWSAFYADPEANPLNTASGKFEIYCQTLAYMVNAAGYSTISPIAKWQIGDPEQGIGTQTDKYPLLLWTPHTLRRAHTVNDNVISLREAFPQECFMSTVDAEARGIANGDIVLMSSPHGQILRPAKVLPTIVPGAVALQDGAWINIDHETGIDKGGCPNILQAPKSSGGGSQSWTGTLVEVEKYTGDIELVPDKECPIVMPVGIEE